MRELKRAAAYGLLLCIAANAFAGETIQYTETVYIQLTRTGDEVNLSNERKVRRDDQSLGIVVNDKTGEVASEWCSGVTFVDPGPNSIASASSCTALYENGDAMLIWLEWVTDNKGAEHCQWKIMGGTGRFSGATGNATTEVTKTLADGSFIGKASVTITMR